jgi:signal transduction histidine kinase
MQQVDARRARARRQSTESAARAVVADTPRLEVRSDYLDAQARSAGESVAQLCRWIFIGVIALLNNLGFVAAQDRVLVDALLGCWVIVSLLVTVLLVVRHRPGRLFTFALTGFDLLVSAALVFFSNGFDSPFFLAMFLTVITSSVRSGVWAGLISSAVIGALYLSVGGLAPQVQATPHDLQMERVGRVFIVVIVGAVTALMTRELLRERGQALKAAAEAEALRELAVNLAAGLGRDEVINAVLERAMNVTGASEASLFLVSGDEITRAGTRMDDDAPTAWDGELDLELLKSIDGLHSMAGGTVLLVPVATEGSTTEVLRLRSASPFSPRARFLAAAMGTTVSGAIAGSIKLQRQARELDTLRTRARELAAQDRRRTDVFSLVSHELRRPLAVLNVYSELLRRDLPGSPAGSAAGPHAAGSVDAMATMAASLREMDLLIDQLQMMSRLDAGEPMPHPDVLDLHEQVELALRAVAPLAGPSHHLSVEYSEPVAVRADPQHVHLMLTNLLGNAVKYSPDGGEVRCSIGRESRHGVVAVSDEGIGVDPGELELLFKRFSRLSNATEAGIGGSGLGLYICRRLARLQSGAVTVVPKEGRGTTFKLLLPLAKR